MNQDDIEIMTLTRLNPYRINLWLDLFNKSSNGLPAQLETTNLCL